MRVSDQALNRLNVLKRIRAKAPISRTELAASTGLSGATITEVTADLINRGLLREEREEKSGRGRPRTHLSIEPAGGIVIGVTLLRNQVLRTTFVDLAGNELESSDAPLGRPPNLADLASRTADILQKAITSSACQRSDIVRIAISLPAVVDSLSGTIHWMTTYDEAPFPFAERIRDQIGLPVTIENDSTCLARAEHWFGKAQELGNFSLFRVGLWVDSAQYVDGLPRVGRNGFNSEIAHVKVDHSSAAQQCLCGAKGCLALYSSIYGIMLRSGVLENFDPQHPLDFLPSYQLLSEQADAGDPHAKQLFDSAGGYLGTAIADHINAFDPGAVFVLMSNERFLNLIRPALETAVARDVFPPLGKNTRIEIALVLDGWRWKGAAAHALEETYLNSFRAGSN